MMTRIFFTGFLAPAVLCISACCCPVGYREPSSTTEKLRTVAASVLTDATFQFVDQKSGKHFHTPEEAGPDAQVRPESPYNDWRYWNGVLNLAMIRMTDVFQEPVYSEFAIRNVAFAFDHEKFFEDRYRNEGKWVYPFGQFFTMEELDDCGAMGASVVEAIRRDPQERYRAYIEKASEHITAKQARLDDGTLVRMFPRRWTLWADDLYMALSFLTRQAEFSGDTRLLDDAVRQVMNFHKYLFDERIGLMHHCWYSDTRRPGVAYWGRANGWAMLAQMDLLDRLPDNHPHADTLSVLLRRHIEGVSRYQSADGLWHQLLDKPDSFLETSCSAMFTYVIARAVNKGYIGTEYAETVRRGWQGVISKIRADGQIEGICTGTGIGDDIQFYYTRPTPLNDIHGIGAVLFAGCEVLHLKAD